MDLKRVLVTGASGFLGTHIVRALQAQEREIIAGLRPPLSAKRLPTIFDTVEKVSLDLMDPESLKAAIRQTQADVVIHAAAYGTNLEERHELTLAIRDNIEGSATLLEAATLNRVARFVHIGSCAEYGDHAHPVTEEAALHPASLYAATKAAASLLVQERGRAWEIPTVVLRLFGLWGPGEGKHRLVPQVLEACRLQKPVALTPCDLLRDLTFVPDMAAAIVNVALRKDFPAGKILNMGSGNFVLLKDFVLRIARHFDSEKFMEFGRRPHRPFEMRTVLPDLKAWQGLGLGPIARTPLERGLEITMQAL